MEGFVPTLSWIGTGLRHIRANDQRDVLDFRYAGSGDSNRWNVPDQPTLYLASDPGVVIAEWGRHISPRFEAELNEDLSSHRDVYSLKVRLDRVVDIRVPETAERVFLKERHCDVLDLEKTRTAAIVIRLQTDAQAMLVPSVAFLDDPSRWNLVVFLEKVPADTALWITDVTRVGPLRWK
jgi:RES domain-containing protein